MASISKILNRRAGGHSLLSQEHHSHQSHYRDSDQHYNRELLPEYGLIVSKRHMRYLNLDRESGTQLFLFF